MARVAVAVGQRVVGDAGPVGLEVHRRKRIWGTESGSTRIPNTTKKCLEQMNAGSSSFIFIWSSKGRDSAQLEVLKKKNGAGNENDSVACQHEERN